MAVSAQIGEILANLGSMEAKVAFPDDLKPHLSPNSLVQPLGNTLPSQ